MIYSIVKYPEAVLETPAGDVTEFNSGLAKLVEDMFESMHVARGVGLAAPQIGISQRVAVIDCSIDHDDDDAGNGDKQKAQRVAIINPEIIHREGRVNQQEGCLSLPDIRENVTRAKKVRVRAQNVKGEWFEMEGENLFARAFQHEIDHLNGILFIRHVSALKRDLIKRRIRKLIKEGNW
ncbi:MAG: peptide deformylase [Acidobacteriaceae bacterium]